MSSVVKHAIERLVVGTGLGSLGRYRHRRDVLILAYHNVLPDGEPVSGDVSLHLAERVFVRQLDALRRTHDVVPLASALDDRPKSARPRAVITFDDAYLGAVTVGVRALVSRGLPATIFVAPGLLGQHTWWDLLATPEDEAVAPAVRDRFLSEFGGDARTILEFAGLNARTPLSAAARIGSETDVAAAAAQPGITIGSHTWSHCNLKAVEAGIVHAELRRSMAWLRDRFTSFVPWLAYPYGLCTPTSERAALEAGFVGALRVDGGWTRSPLWRDRYALPRINIPAGVSVDGFRLRIDGTMSG